MKKFITAALFAITLAFSPTAMAEEVCWTAADFAVEAAEHNDPAIAEVGAEYIVPLVTAVHGAMKAVGIEPTTRAEWAANAWYTYTMYPTDNGFTPAAVVATFAENGCLLDLVLVPIRLLHDVLNDPAAGSL